MKFILEEFYVKKLKSVHSPQPLDMALISIEQNEALISKGYLFTELFPDNPAEKLFGENRYQYWEFQKPYILQVLKTVKNLLIHDRIFFSDFRPLHTVFNPISRKMSIVYFGKCLNIGKDQNIEKYNIKDKDIIVSAPFCPPEWNKIEGSEINLKKSISYLCGMSIAFITSEQGEFFTNSYKINKQNLGKKTDLNEDLKKSLTETIFGLIEFESSKRLDINQAIKNIENIGSNEYIRKAIYGDYIKKVREIVMKNPSVLYLNKDILYWKETGIIPQKVVERNCTGTNLQKINFLTDELEEIFKSDQNQIFLLLGDRGSGKSLAIQLRFIKSVFDWEYGKAALPVYLNMSNDVSLENFFRRNNTDLGCNLDLEAENENMDLFIDSYDERHTTKQQSIITFFEEYIQKLDSWMRKKIFISCRTEYLKKQENLQNISNLTFKLGQSSCFQRVRVRYILPVDYGLDEHSKIKLIENWLEKAKVAVNANELHQKIEKLKLDKKLMKGLNFNILMKIFLSTNSVKIKQNSSSFQFLGLVINEELIENLKYALSKDWKIQREQIRFLKSDCEAFLSSEEIVQYYTRKEKISSQSSCKDDIEVEKEIIMEGLERLGERMALEMTKRRISYLSFSEIEKLIGETKSSMASLEGVRAKWKTLYHIFYVLGMKIRKLDLQHYNDKDDYLEVAFKGESYKNYFLLRGFKRIFMQIDFSLEKKSDAFMLVNNQEIVKNIIDDPMTLKNHGLLKFFGNEIKHDKNFQNKLMQVLKREQKTPGIYFTTLKPRLHVLLFEIFKKP